MTGAGVGAGHFDPAKLDDLRALERPGNEGFFARIINTFLTDASRRLCDIREGLKEGDYSAVVMAAHTLKGSCSYVGAVRLAGQMRALEEAAHTGPPPEGLVDDIRAELESLRTLLAQEIEPAK
ncbi:MAG TPA: Hpt domain-containing protein [Actinomycetota bacterium]|nr:Hpt domain-containing protein [Actinomycetota bacterium]